MKRTEIKCLASIVCIFLAMSVVTSALAAQRIKTSYKHYSIFTFQDKHILCEPYIVQKNDWLFKIFKQKGEISEQDFPFFISIFKQLNPHIHNIDAIAAGERILIPLKMVGQQDFTPDDDGMVEVPVVEFNDITDTFTLDQHIQAYTVQPGDMISKLVDTVFLQKGRVITREGQLLFYHLNPGIKNIDLVHPGDRVVLPKPSILNHAWRRMLTKPNQPVVSARQDRQVVSPYQIVQLQQYAAAIKSTLIHQGKMVFPGRNGEKDVQLDLSQTPLIETNETDEKTLLIPHHPGGGHILDEQLLRQITSYWRQLKIEPIETVIQKLAEITTKPTSPPAMHSFKNTVPDILSHTKFEYFPEEKIRFTMDHIPVSATLDRVKRPGRADLLLNFGTVYGQGLIAIQDLGFEVLSFPPGLSQEDQIKGLLSALGYTIWKNPAFNHRGKVETLEGIYAEQSESRLFISPCPLTPGARVFFEARQIRYIHLKE
jgi:hypothetical protein